MQREIFHLAFPVRDLDVTRDFYLNAQEAIAYVLADKIIEKL